MMEETSVYLGKSFRVVAVDVKNNSCYIGEQGFRVFCGGGGEGRTTIVKVTTKAFKQGGNSENWLGFSFNFLSGWRTHKFGIFQTEVTGSF